jgi:hypothetical protein
MRRTVCRAQHSQLARTASSNTRSTPEKRAMSAVAPCSTALTVLRQRRALDVLNRAGVPCQLCARLLRDGHERGTARHHAPLRQVGAQVQLRPDEEHTRIGHRAADLGTPLRAYSVRHILRMACVRPHLVLDARDALGVREREAQDEYVCLRVRERAQAVVVVAAAGVAQVEAHTGAVHLGVHSVAVEHCV